MLFYSNGVALSFTEESDGTAVNKAYSKFLIFIEAYSRENTATYE